MLGYQPLNAPFCAGKLKPPGGRFEPDEQPKQCAIRETLEETGIRPILEDQPLGFVIISHDDGPVVNLYVYRTTRFVGEPQSLEKLEKVGWYEINETTVVQMMEGDRHFIDYVIRNRPFKAILRYSSDGNLEYSIIELTKEGERVEQ